MRTALFLAGLIGMFSTVVHAQSEPSAKRIDSKYQTEVTVQLYTDEQGVGLRAQRWSEAFQQMNVTLSIRRGTVGRTPAVTDKVLGGLRRRVTLVGKLDKQGRLIFEERVFTEADTGKLKAWINDLKAFGAQGDPSGKPLWGLSQEQFAPIQAALNKTLETDLHGKLLQKAIEDLDLPATVPLRFTAAARHHLAELDRVQPATVQLPLKGLSKGTALAILLHQAGLGFRPTRNQDASIDLSVWSLKATDDVWPVGWPQKKSNRELAPKLVQLTPIALQDIELLPVLETVSEVTGIPILIDQAGFRAEAIDLAKVKVSYPSRQATWSAALKSLVFQAKGRAEIWTDEAGHPFIWVTPLSSKRRKVK